MIPQKAHVELISSGNMKTAQASIEMTEEMFDMLSSKVYKNKILAVVREITCNAKDAHMMNGVDKAIDIHAPNRLEPYLTIRDYGGGLSETDIMSLYLRYGHSDKRSTNDAIGGLGIGSKSPLAYSDSFIVTSFFEGTKTVYSVHKDKGIPQVSKLTSSSTNEEGGLEVKVAVRTEDTHEFTTNLTNFLRFFDYPVNVKGAQLNIDKPTVGLDTKLYTTYKVDYGYHNSGVKAIMGGVVYDISNEITNTLHAPTDNVIMHLKFGIGELSVAASRESLSEDKATVETLKQRVKDINRDYYDDIQTKIHKCDTREEVYNIIVDNRLLKRSWGSDMELIMDARFLTYDGVPIDSEFFKHCEVNLRTITKEYGKSAARDMRRSLRSMNNPIFLNMDRKQGGLKLAKKLSEDNDNRTVILTYDQEDKDKIESYYGKVDYLSATEQYSIKFPKGQSTSVKVSKSGLYTLGMKEVTELDESSEGHYMLFNRDACEAEGFPDDLYETVGLNEIRTVLNALAEKGKLVKDEVYICRKGGIPAVKKTKLKPLTWKQLTGMLSSLYSKKEILDNIMRETNCNLLALSCRTTEILGTLKKDFPVTVKVLQYKEGSRGTYVSAPSYIFEVLKLIDPAVVKVKKEMVKALRDEAIRFTKYFPLYSNTSNYGWTSEILADLNLYFKNNINYNSKTKSK